jgi:hypothetical protein
MSERGAVIGLFVVVVSVVSGTTWLADKDWVQLFSTTVNTLAIAVTFVAVWWTASETSRLRKLTQKQLKQTENATAKAAIPRLVIRQERVRVPSGDRYYVVLNVGPGLAARAYYYRSDAKSLQVLSPLAAGDRLVLPDDAQSSLRPSTATSAACHYLLSQSIDSRWFLSRNVVSPSNGNVASVTEPHELEPERLTEISDLDRTFFEQLRRHLEAATKKPFRESDQ